MSEHKMMPPNSKTRGPIEEVLFGYEAEKQEEGGGAPEQDIAKPDIKKSEMGSDGNKTDEKPKLTSAKTLNEKKQEIKSSYGKSIGKAVGVVALLLLVVLVINAAVAVNKKNEDMAKQQQTLAIAESNKSKLNSGLANKDSWQSIYESKVSAISSELNSTKTQISELAKNQEEQFKKIQNMIAGSKSASSGTMKPLVTYAPQKTQVNQQPLKQLPPYKKKPEIDDSDLSSLNGDDNSYTKPAQYTKQTQSKQQSNAGFQNSNSAQPGQMQQQNTNTPYYSKPQGQFSGVKLSSGGGANPKQQSIIGTQKQDSSNIKLVMPMGIAKAVLVSGVAAPTYSQGADNPAPVLLKIDSDLIAANNERAELQDCTILGTAVGKLESQRATIRLSKISCVVTKGKQKFYVSKAVQGWVLDENSVEGLPGRLVSKVGQKMAQAMAAGMLQGLAGAFAPTSNMLVPGVGTISTLGSSASVGEKMSNGASNGISQGTQNALGKIADYYLKLADESKPVVYIRGGREVDILFKGDEELPLSPYSPIKFQTQGGKQ